VGETRTWPDPAPAAKQATDVDRALVDRAADGDVDAFDRLIRSRIDRLFRLAMAILRSEPDARDAVQEASIQAWRELPRLRDRDRFDAWISQILVNGCRSMLRRGNRVRIREIDVAGLGDDPAERGLTVGSSAEDHAEVEAIRRAFDRLDGDTRSLLVLHYVEEQPIAQIAQQMGSPAGTIKWRLSNARRALSRALEVERR
jgi:RNA polymerase sigma-70 factor, ECF subfamily